MVNEKIANDLFDQMVLFAEYCFNKSHSTAYGAVTYQTAFLKAHFREYFYSEELNLVINNGTKTKEYIDEVKTHNIEVITPDINLSIDAKNKE